MKIFENEYIYMEVEESCIPWIKIFAKQAYKEITDCDETTRRHLFHAALIVEREMRSYFQPEKVNWASFGNMLPRVHLHIQARFTDDAYFPQSVWGEKQRESQAQIAPMEPFLTELVQKMQTEL